MNAKTVIAIVLIALGIVSLAYQGITYTSREKVVDIGPIQATAETTKKIPLPPIAGILMLVAGVVVLVQGRKA